MDAGQIIELISLLLVGGVALSGTIWKILNLINEVRINLSNDIEEVDGKRSQNNKEIHEKIDQTAESLDVKFNIIRNEISGVKDNYVRRDDLNAHLARFEKGQETQTAAIDRLRQRFDEGFLDLVRTLAAEKK